jgi:hypothetical protein
MLGECLFVAGGFAYKSSVERYDAATNTWTAVADMLEGRYDFDAVTIASVGPASTRSSRRPAVGNYELLAYEWHSLDLHTKAYLILINFFFNAFLKDYQ